MNAHEVIDRFSARSPRAKTLTCLAVAAVIIGGLVGAFFLGTWKGRDWADSKYLRESAERDKAVAVLEADADRHIKNEAQLAAENSLLRKQNEATAEILSQNDKKAAAESAKKFTQLGIERTKQYEIIDVDRDYDSQLCGMCTEAMRSGHKLGESLCGRCKGNP